MAIAITTTLASCGPIPQSPAEFRQAIKGGGFATRFEERDINRGFDQVFGDVGSRAEKCLNTSKTSSTPGTYGPETSTVNYRATVTKRADGVGEIVIQQNAANLVGDIPEGGVYIQVVDVEPRGGTSHVAVYGSTLRDELFDVFFAWAEGKNVECPDL